MTLPVTSGRRRVLVVSQSQARVGGRETYVASVLSALREAGHEVATWFESSEMGRDSVLDRTADAPSWTAASCDDDLASVRAWRPDVVFVNSLESATWERTFTRIAPAVRFLHSYDGACVSGTKTWRRPTPQPCERVLGPACLAHYFARGCGGRSPATLLRLYGAERQRQALLPDYARLLVASRYMRDEYARQGLEDIVRVVPLPVDMPGRAVADLPATDLADATRPWRVLYLGRFEPTKGAHLALEAAAMVVRSTSRTVRLQLSGDGAQRASLAQRAAQLMAENPGLDVALTSWLTQADTRAALDGSDLLVVPSLWPEPFGMVGVEAARRGVPAVAFDAGGISEWLTDGRTGVLVAQPSTAARLAEALGDVLRDGARWQAMRETCLRGADRFTPAAHVRALEAVFDEVLGPAAQEAPMLMHPGGDVDIRTRAEFT